MEFQNIRKRYPEAYDHILRRAKVDRDFRKVCQDFEETGNMIEQMKGILAEPLQQIENRVKEYEKLLAELRSEIEYFMKYEIKSSRYESDSN